MMLSRLSLLFGLLLTWQVWALKWDTKLILYPSTNETLTPVALSAPDNDCVHFLFPVGNSKKASYKYRKLRPNGSLSSLVQLSKEMGPPDSTLGLASDKELLFVMINNTGQTNPILARTSFDNGDTWQKIEVLYQESRARLFTSFARSVTSSRIWVYYYSFSIGVRIRYNTRPPESRIFSNEMAALDYNYGYAYASLKPLVTYGPGYSIVHLLALNNKGLLYAYSTDNGISYASNGVAYPYNAPHEVAAAPEYSNSTVYIAVSNQLKWSDDFGTTYHEINMTDHEVANVSIAICSQAGKWKVHYFAILADDTAIYYTVSLPEHKVDLHVPPFNKRYTSLAPKLLCLYDKVPKHSAVGLVADDSSRQTVFYIAHYP